MKEKVLIIGAGISGCTIARLFAEHDYDVTIFDKRKHVGGNVYDEVNADGIIEQPYGPHIFHTNDEAVFKFLSRFTNWKKYQHIVEGYVLGKLTPIPFNFKGIDIHFDEFTASIFKAKLLKIFEHKSKVSIFELRQSNDDELKYLADFVYKNIFEKYSRKQWGFSPEKLGKEVMERVPIRLNYEEGYFSDKYQVQPDKGFSKMIESMLNHPNIKVRTNCNVRLNSNEIKDLNATIIYTGSIDELCDYKFGKLPYRSLKFKIKTLNKAEFQHRSVVNYNTSRRFTRITEFKKLYDQECEKTTICKEYPSKLTEKLEPYYPIPTKEAKELYDKYCDELRNCHNLFFLGRLGTYKYLNMDAAVKQAMTLFEYIHQAKSTERIIKK